jgi:hypothetical protein
LGAENDVNREISNLESPSGTLIGFADELRSLSRWPVVCTENLILFDYVTESPNVNGDDRAALLLPDPTRLAVQVEEPT